MPEWRTGDRRAAAGSEPTDWVADVSAPGRSTPSREMVLHLAEHLEVSLRERNILLKRCRDPPVYVETDLAAPMMSAVNQAFSDCSGATSPTPQSSSIAGGTLVAANAGIASLAEVVDPEPCQPFIDQQLHAEGWSGRTRSSTATAAKRKASRTSSSASWG